MATRVGLPGKGEIRPGIVVEAESRGIEAWMLARENDPGAYPALRECYCYG